MDASHNQHQLLSVNATTEYRGSRFILRKSVKLPFFCKRNRSLPHEYLVAAPV